MIEEKFILTFSGSPTSPEVSGSGSGVRNMRKRKSGGVRIMRLRHHWSSSVVLDR
jgi:hypothetical protein